MTVLVSSPTDEHHVPPHQVSLWRYRWDVTMTRRIRGTSVETINLTVDDPDELADLIRQTSLDPRVLVYEYHRRTELDLTDAPKVCHSPGCGELFSVTAPRQHWHHCCCGGHLATTCLACGSTQMYPPINADTCAT